MVAGLDKSAGEDLHLLTGLDDCRYKARCEQLAGGGGKREGEGKEQETKKGPTEAARRNPRDDLLARVASPVE